MFGWESLRKRKRTASVLILDDGAAAPRTHGIANHSIARAKKLVFSAEEYSFDQYATPTYRADKMSFYSIYNL
jgi:hypothetical protein